MIKKYSLVFIVCLCFIGSGYGQILTFEFSGLSGNEITANSNSNNPNLTNSTISRGVGLTASVNADRFNATNWALENIANAVSGNNYMEFTVTANASYQFDVTSIVLYFQRSGTGNRGLALRSSKDGYAVNIDTEKTVLDNTTTQSFTFSVNQLNNTSPVTYRVYGWAEAIGGSGGIGDRVGGDDIIVNGSVALISTSDLSISGTLDHGPACITTATATQTYTITNNGVSIATIDSVVSNNPQFVVSNLSTNTILPGLTATYDVTFTPTTVGAKAANITVNSLTSGDATSNLIGTGISTPNITTPPANQNVVIPNTATFSVVATNATSYQWQLNTGTGWNNIPGATTASYTTGATNASMNNNQYRCVVTNTCGSVNSNPATLTLSNASPNNAQNLSGCFEDTSVILSWNNPVTPPTGGYVIFAIAGTIDPTAPTNDANTYTANANFNAAPFETPASLGKVVYKGTGTTATVTGLTEDITYSFRIFGYNGSTLTGWSNGTTIGSNLENIAQGDIRNFVATPLTNQVTLNWLNPLPTDCWNDILIVANQGPVVFTPTGNGSAYNANPVYAGANQVVYKGTGNSVAVTGLTNGINYCFRAYIRRGTTWTLGVEVCTTPSLTYCASDGGISTNSGILNVKLNTIDNTSDSTNGYTDFTSTSTTVILGDQHNLSVNVNTGGNYTAFVKAWIDWNSDGSFNNAASSNEVYELGTATNSNNSQPSLSPITVLVPTNATIGNIRMRVSSKTDNGEPYATPCEDFSYGEVEDYTIIVQQPTGAEINIKGNNISINNGFNTPYGLNNTLFGPTNVSTNGPEKTYVIENIGQAALNLTGATRVEIIGTNGTGNTEFTVTQLPTATVASTGTSDFKIQFTPLIQGTRTATVRILNSDTDENPYEFTIEGNATCSSALTSNIWPIEGPEDTEVTITSATDLTGATASINGVTMDIISSTGMELVVLVPTGALDGNLVVIFANGCTSSNSFDIIDTVIGGCESTSSNTLSELFISEVTDATSGSSSYVEIFNGTPNPINLSNYKLNIYNNGSTSPSSSNALTGTLASGGIYVVSIGSTSCSLNNLSVSPNQTFSTSSGINFNNNSSDMIALYKISITSIVDAYGVFGSDTWSNGLGIGVDGVNFRRKNTATPLPSAIFNINDWDVIDWTSCGDSDYVNIGLYDFSTGVPPTVTVLSPPPSSCDMFRQLSVTGTEGVSGSLGLTYQWYYLAPNTNTFVVVPNNADFNNVTLSTLDILNALNYDGYQFYCQVRENTATCYKASNAIKLELEKTIWDGVWSSTPSSDKVAYITANYDTSNIANGDGETSFRACSLVVSSGVELTIDNNTFVEVQNNVINNGTITINTSGSLVQVYETGIFSSNPSSGINILNKFTAPLQYWYDYTYWSSPLENAQIETALFTSNVNRRFYFDASKYNDTQIENANTNTFSPGQDDIDDEGDDWTLQQTGKMIPGLGYAATHDNVGFASNNSYQYIFEGNSTNSSGGFNTGPKTVNIYINPGDVYNDWNLIGNPYPSAINATDFFEDTSTFLEGVIYLWSHETDANSNTAGNENSNFSQDDYAILNYVGGVAVGTNSPNGSSSGIPNGYIASGQGFFVIGNKSGASSGAGYYSETVFNNSMRVTGNNTQFFRTSSPQNKLWVNLTADNGIFNQILIGYVEGATNTLDPMKFDALRNLSTTSSSILYSTIVDSDKKFAIQGKDPSSLDLDEVIPLGFYTDTEEPTIYKLSIAQIEGEFLSNNTIYLKDNLLNITHTLSESDYTFTSETGEFNYRFEIVFRDEALSVYENEITSNDLSIIELNDGSVKFTIANHLDIKTVEIIDMLGRTLYKLKGNSNTEIYDLSNLSQAAYIAKVNLSNGQTITKRAIKRK